MKVTVPEKSAINGFTLVELLITVTIVAFLGYIFTDILTQTLRGQNKIKTINQIKQNGQIALDKMINDIRQSERVVCFGKFIGAIDADSLVLYKQGEYIRYRFYPPAPATDPTANGRLAVDYPAASQAAVPDICTTVLQTNETNITDIDTQSGVSLNYSGLSGFTNTVFNVDSDPGYGDNIAIKFRGNPGVKAGSTYEVSVEDGGVLFETTAQIRGTSN